MLATHGVALTGAKLFSSTIITCWTAGLWLTGVGLAVLKPSTAMFGSSDARYHEMFDDNIPSQKYLDIGIPRYLLLDAKVGLLLLYVLIVIKLLIVYHRFSNTKEQTEKVSVFALWYWRSCDTMVEAMTSSHMCICTPTSVNHTTVCTKQVNSAWWECIDRQCCQTVYRGIFLKCYIAHH